MPDPAVEVVENDEQRRRRDWLRRQVRRLPRPQQDVYELVIYGELPHDDVAEILGIPVGTVKSRMARARSAIAAAVGPNLHPSDELVIERAMR